MFIFSSLFLKFPWLELGRNQGKKDGEEESI